MRSLIRPILVALIPVAAGSLPAAASADAVPTYEVEFSGSPAETGTRGAARDIAAVSEGVVRWRFQVSGQYILHSPAVGPDGGVVVVSSSGNVYSLTATGSLRWVVPSVGDGGGPTIGADGTVYVASINTITAIAPDGSIRWRFTEPRRVRA